MTFRITDGSPAQLGVAPDGSGANIAVFSSHATAIDFCLFDSSGSSEIERIRLPVRSRDIFHGHVTGIKPGMRYGFRAHGPYDPHHGHRFNHNKLLIDPYAWQIDRPFALHPAMFGYIYGDARGDLSFDEHDSAPFMPKAIIPVEQTTTATALAPVPWADTIIYELHVRGFTKLHPDIPLQWRGTFAGLSHPKSLEHLIQLGVTTIELMPIAAWIDERHLMELGLTNYWGYNPVAMMAPDPRLAPGGWNEIRAAVATLHAANIEVLLDVVFNHTGEGDALGPTVSFRGLDNASYYRLKADNKRAYVDDAGCGNVLALHRPAGAAIAIEAMTRWVTHAGVDGFRFDLATSLGRNEHGFDPHAPLIEAIASHPVLSRSKLIAEPWDLGANGYQLGAFPPSWPEWNDRFRDSCRRFWRGDSGMIGEMGTRLAGSSDVFGASQPSRSVNFITSHDGFTLADLVSYAHKNNSTNGENNRDGTDHNLSWNNGIEGTTDDPEIIATRKRDQRNLIATLLLARGTPMIAMGTELGHSQNGNNNAYAQDNSLTWIDWESADQSLLAFCRKVIRLRKSHRSIRNDRFLTGHTAEFAIWPDVEWLLPGGGAMTPSDWQDERRQILIAAFYTAASVDADADRVLIILNAAREPVHVRLPAVAAGRCWGVLLDTSDGDNQQRSLRHEEASDVFCEPASVVMLAETGRASSRRSEADVPTELLDRLAHAVGIVSDWHDIDGRRHLVSASTQRAILQGFGFCIATCAQVRDSLLQLSETYERRLLPWSSVAREGNQIRVSIAPDRDRKLAVLIVELESGERRTFEFRPDNLAYERLPGLDGRSVQGAVATLPPQPIGRHILFLEDHPEIKCQITVAPGRCYLPEALENGKRMFGIAAQAYALRRAGDQGIGDFTALGQLAELATDRGAAMIGLSPMHALFSHDRMRASPYHPSDRRFLDPIYIDIESIGAIDNALHPSDALSVSGAEDEVLRKLEEVDYPGVWALKRHALEESYKAFVRLRDHSPNALALVDFNDFVTRGGESLQMFAAFELISELHQGRTPRQWPRDLADKRRDAVAEITGRHVVRHGFHLYLQWLCERQFADAAAQGARRGLPIGFYRDLAVGAAPDGAEIWTHGDQFLHGLSIGAPPDPFAAAGQIWNLPPPNPLAWRQSAFSVFRDLIRSNMNHAGALRIDHVMGLSRLFVVPDGADGADGAYLRYPLKELLGELSLESTRARCLVVGEALGTVPEGFHEEIGANGVLSYRVLWFEREGAVFKPPSAYDRQSIACISTHDLATLRGWWECVDISEREELGQLLPGEASAARLARANDRRNLMAALSAQELFDREIDLDGPFQMSLGVAVHAFIGRSTSALVITQLDDLIAERVAVNLPGTDRERPNWRRRLSAPLNDLFAGDADAMLSAMAVARKVH
jgi:glycogen operon protein